MAFAWCSGPKRAVATSPLPRSAAMMMLGHKARSRYTGAQSFVFASRTGRALSQHNLLRELYRAQERAHTPEGNQRE